MYHNHGVVIAEDPFQHQQGIINSINRLQDEYTQVLDIIDPASKNTRAREFEGITKGFDDYFDAFEREIFGTVPVAQHDDVPVIETGNWDFPEDDHFQSPEPIITMNNSSMDESLQSTQPIITHQETYNNINYSSTPTQKDTPRNYNNVPKLNARQIRNLRGKIPDDISKLPKMPPFPNYAMSKSEAEFMLSKKRKRTDLQKSAPDQTYINTNPDTFHLNNPPTPPPPKRAKVVRKPKAAPKSNSNEDTEKTQVQRRKPGRPRSNLKIPLPDSNFGSASGFQNVSDVTVHYHPHELQLNNNSGLQMPGNASPSSMGKASVVDVVRSNEIVNANTQRRRMVSIGPSPLCNVINVDELPDNAAVAATYYQFKNYNHC